MSNIGEMGFDDSTANGADELPSYEYDAKRAAVSFKERLDSVHDGIFSVVLPTSAFSQNWDIVMTFLLTYVAIVTPFDTSFLTPSVDGLFFVNRWMDMMFLYDMILQFNTAFPNEFGELEKSRPRIAQSYLSGWFPIDFISLLPYDLFSVLGEADGPTSSLKGFRVLRVLRLIKMLRLLRANRVLEHFETNKPINYSRMQLYSFIVALLLLIHWLACGWYLVLDLEEAEECIPYYHSSMFPENDPVCCFNWLDCYYGASYSDGLTTARKYMLAVVWSVGQVLTVGSEIHSMTDTERVYEVFTEMLCGLVYAYLLGAICSIFTSMSKQQTMFYEQMDQLNLFLHEKNVDITDPLLCAALRLFYRFAYRTMGSSHAMADILTTISPTLKGQIALAVHSKWMWKLPLFDNTDLSPQFFVSMALSLNTHLCAPMEVIIEPHHIADTLYVVEKGMILSKAPKPVKVNGDPFGEDAIAAWRNDMERGYQATSFTHGGYYSIPASTLMDLINRPQYKEEAALIRKRVTKQRGIYLVIYFAKQVHKSVKAGEEDFLVGAAELTQELSFVDKSAMAGILQIFARTYLKTYPQKLDDTNAIEEGIRSLLLFGKRSKRSFIGESDPLAGSPFSPTLPSVHSFKDSVLSFKTLLSHPVQTLEQHKECDADAEPRMYDAKSEVESSGAGSPARASADGEAGAGVGATPNGELKTPSQGVKTPSQGVAAVVTLKKLSEMWKQQAVISPPKTLNAATNVQQVFNVVSSDARVSELEEVLACAELEDLAVMLVEKHDLDRKTLLRLDVNQLQSCGIPMRKAFKLRESMDRQHGSEIALLTPGFGQPGRSSVSDPKLRTMIEAAARKAAEEVAREYLGGSAHQSSVGPSTRGPTGFNTHR